MDNIIQNWIQETGTGLILFVLFSAGFLGIGLLWAALEALETSRLGNFTRTLLCVPIIIAGWFCLSFLLVLFARESYALGQVLKTSVEGPWICYVFFKVIPNKGRYIVMPVLRAWCLFQGSVIYFGIINAYNFMPLDSLSSLIAVTVTVLVYRYLWLEEKKS